MSSAYSSIVLFDAPVVYYRLGEASGTTAADSSGNGNNGTYSAGGVTYAQTGLIAGDVNTAVKLDGAAGDVTIPTTHLPSGAAPWTYECWFKSTQNNAGLALFQLGTQTTTLAVSVYYTSSGGNLNLYDGTSHTATGVVSDNTAYYLVVTYDGTTLTMYLNASNIKSAADALNITYGSALIGTDTFNDFFGGIIDEVAIYSGALSPARITAHYNAGITTIAPGGTPRRGERYGRG